MASASDFDFEKGWGRRESFRVLDTPTITHLLKPALGFRSPVSVEPLTDGKANTNYHVSVEGGEEFVLRAYTNDSEACRRDVALFELVKGDVPVPEIIFSEAQPDDFDHPYTVFRWIDGLSMMEALASGVEVLGLGITLGETLAAINSHRFVAMGSLGPDLSVRIDGMPDLLDYITECLTDPATSLDPTLVDQALDFVRLNDDLLPRSDDAAVLVHGDFKARQRVGKPRRCQLAGHWRPGLGVCLLRSQSLRSCTASALL